MRKALAGLLLLAGLAVAVPPSALAGSATDAALGLGAFAVFNQLLTGQTIFHQGFGPRYFTQETVIVQPPPAVIYAPPPQVIYAPPPPPVVLYPNGYYAHGYAYTPSPYAPYYRHYRRHHHDDDDDD
jgi:hypothetical protein